MKNNLNYFKTEKRFMSLYARTTNIQTLDLNLVVYYVILTFKMILNSCDMALCKSKITLVKQKRRNPQLQNTERFPLVVRTSNAWLPFFVLQGHAVYSVEI